ncbi:MAG TPA: hydroxymethylbilane synthase, partial [bacterium]|nr:hydroxymethylbilane synthase [bacterium]
SDLPRLAVASLRPALRRGQGGPAVFVGTGCMVQAVLHVVRSNVPRDLWVVSRDAERARRLAAPHGATGVSMDAFLEGDQRFRAILFATRCESPLVDSSWVRRHVGPDTVLVDLGLPRNVEPGACPPGMLLNLETLRERQQHNQAQRSEIVRGLESELSRRARQMHDRILDRSPERRTQIRAGTRASALARAQTTLVREALGEQGIRCDEILIRTLGDRTDRPFEQMEGKAFFTKELEEALCAREVDLAVHSLKDLLTEDSPGLRIAAVMSREDPRDVLLVKAGRTWRERADGLPDLPPCSRVGTSSARRRTQLLSVFPDVQVRDLRGNVPTRVEKLRQGDYDAIVVAQAGLNRLGLEHPEVRRYPLDAPRFLPAPGQGAIAIQIRRHDPHLTAALRRLHDPRTEACVVAERTLLSLFQGGCGLPLGALARWADDEIVLEACLAREGRMLRASARGRQPRKVARAVHRRLLRQDGPSAHRPNLRETLA